MGLKLRSELATAKYLLGAIVAEAANRGAIFTPDSANIVMTHCVNAARSLRRKARTGLADADHGAV